MERVYITLGCGNKFDITKFEPIGNIRGSVKPRGGLWSSPVDSEWGWKQWCESEGYSQVEKGTEFRFKLKEGSKVYRIDSIGDLLSVPYRLTDPYTLRLWGPVIDFEKMAEQYDAIHLTVGGERVTRYSDYEFGMSLYGWDCETLLILRPDCVEEV
jgi:hypothetical protein